MLEKILLALMIAAFMIVPAGCGKTKSVDHTASSKQQIQKVKVGMVADTSGFRDESSNAAAYRGLQKAERDLGSEIKVLESKQDADYNLNLTTLVKDGYDLTWGIGPSMANALAKTAQEFPDHKFGIVDYAYIKDGENVTPRNVICVTFREEEGSFLMGVIAAKMTKSKTVGFLGGEENELTKKYEYGYRAGVAAVDPGIKVFSGYTASFTDSAKGIALANSMYDLGADVIYHKAGEAGNGLFTAVQEHSKDGKQVWAIGADSDQNQLAPQNTLSSMVKLVDIAVFDITNRLANGEWRGGQIVSYGLKEGAIVIAPTTNKNTPQEVFATVNSYKQKIITGEILVPKTKDEFNKYMLNLLK